MLHPPPSPHFVTIYVNTSAVHNETSKKSKCVTIQTGFPYFQNQFCLYEMKNKSGI